MNLNLVARNVGARAPARLSGRAYSRTSSGVQGGGRKTGPPPPQKPGASQTQGEWTASRASASEETVKTGSGQGQSEWMASRASASEEAVKADRGGDVFKNYKEMQEKTKKVAEEMKGSTESMRDGLWRSVGGGR